MGFQGVLVIGDSIAVCNPFARHIPVQYIYPVLAFRAVAVTLVIKKTRLHFRSPLDLLQLIKLKLIRNRGYE